MDLSRIRLRSLLGVGMYSPLGLSASSWVRIHVRDRVRVGGASVRVIAGIAAKVSVVLGLCNKIQIRIGGERASVRVTEVVRQMIAAAVFCRAASTAPRHTLRLMPIGTGNTVLGWG